MLMQLITDLGSYRLATRCLLREGRRGVKREETKGQVSKPIYEVRLSLVLYEVPVRVVKGGAAAAGLN